MLPESSLNTLASETEVATACEPMSVDNNNTIEPFTPKGNTSYRDTSSSFSLTTTSSYLYRIPSGSRQWEFYLKDLIDSKAKRSRRMKNERESVNDFLQRFPIFEA